MVAILSTITRQAEVSLCNRRRLPRPADPLVSLDASLADGIDKTLIGISMFTVGYCQRLSAGLFRETGGAGVGRPDLGGP